jgi:archaellum component FlaC
MSEKTIVIKLLKRTSADGEAEELQFQPGINVIAGPPNTGKTKWLRMLDCLMGDAGKPEDSFGADLAEKYDYISATIRIGEEEIRLERFWKRQGAKSKVFIDDVGVLASDFSEYLLGKLGFPILHFPQGNPYSERAWPELSWRMLLRHIYRQERFWSDIADRQPESEQHACLMQFLGVARLLFPQQLGKVVEKRKQRLKLEAKKEQFTEILEEVSREITSAAEINIAPTVESIEAAISRLHMSIEALMKRREQVLRSLKSTDTLKMPGISEGDLTELSVRWSELHSLREVADRALNKARSRLTDLEDYSQALQDELDRLKRAKTAGDFLADIKITHCPACDQPLEPRDIEPGSCELCCRPIADGDSESVKRIDFEFEQISEEIREVKELIAKLRTDESSRLREMNEASEEISSIDGLLHPVRTAVAAVLPPEISIIDQKIGGLNEQISQLGRIKKALGVRDELTAQIDKIEQEIKALDAEISTVGQEINLSHCGDMLADGMNSYLNALNATSRERWPEGAVRVKLEDRKFNFKVQDANWSTKLGATLQAYFLMSYHYALMSLSGQPQYNYPGLVILDFPPTFADGSVVADKENYIIEPFQELANRLAKLPVQLIAAGRSFEGLQAANRIDLRQVWK